MNKIQRINRILEQAEQHREQLKNLHALLLAEHGFEKYTPAAMDLRRVLFDGDSYGDALKRNMRRIARQTPPPTKD